MTFLLSLLAACASDPPAPAPVQAPPPAPVAAPEPPPPPPEPPPPAFVANPPPEGWLELSDHIDGLRTDIRYHTADNFTGAPLPGYGAPGAWLQREPAEALVRVQADLADEGMGLLVYDAYRPLRGTLAMVAWAHRTDQVNLLDDGYIARRSGHNKGNTIDLSIVDLATGEELDMGTPWDTLSEASHTTKAEGEPLANRLLLRKVMHAHGWKNYWKEWWHYSYKTSGPLPHRDVPYGCWEPAEGEWEAPEGWRDPGHIMPAEVVPQPCTEG